MRQELREKFDIAYKRFRRSYDIISRSQLLRQQREVAEEQQKALETQRHLMIESQEQRKATDAQIQLILDSQKSLISPQSDTKPRNQDIETALVLEDTD